MDERNKLVRKMTIEVNDFLINEFGDEGERKFRNLINFLKGCNGDELERLSEVRASNYRWENTPRDELNSEDNCRKTHNMSRRLFRKIKGADPNTIFETADELLRR